MTGAGVTAMTASDRRAGVLLWVATVVLGALAIASLVGLAVVAWDADDGSIAPATPTWPEPSEHRSRFVTDLTEESALIPVLDGSGEASGGRIVSRQSDPFSPG